ncbi:MAG TPA: carboxypeptidase-like regulatory domain-containing protein, partial [Vicinamibacterales bacterium]|nr:carboxypeptidase-like regulatory domain-containing protein [Vicinamibacterales bacterium]
APTFFPSTTSAADAQRVTVGVGTIAGDVVIAMTAIKTSKVSGTAVDSTGQPMSGMLMVIQTTDNMGTTVSGSLLRPDGSFSVANLTPGEYTLRAQQRPGGDEMATMKITVAGVDITDLRLVASGMVSVSGRVVVDPGQSLQAGALSIMAAPVQADSMMFNGGRGPGKVGIDNAFVLKSGPGQVRLRVLGLPKGWDVRAVRLRGVDVTDSGLDIKPNEEVDGIDVELTNRLTSVIGLVTDARGEATKDYTTVIFPQDQNLWTNPARYIKIGRPDQDGRFTIAGLPPGDYYAVALDHLDPGKISDPEFLNAVRSGARAFSLAEAETKSLDLKLSTGS